MQALGFTLLDFNPAKDNVIKIALIIKGTNADLSPGKGLVDGRFHGLLHIIEINVDFSSLDIPYDLEVMELSVFPWNPLLGKNEVFPGSLIDDEDLAGVRVGLFAEVEVIKVGRILVIEEEAEVTMPSRGLGGLDPGGENEGAHDFVFEQSNTVGAAKGGAISGDSEELVDLVAIHGGKFPLTIIGGLPCAGILGEVFLVDHGEFFFGLSRKRGQGG